MGISKVNIARLILGGLETETRSQAASSESQSDWAHVGEIGSGNDGTGLARPKKLGECCLIMGK